MTSKNLFKLKDIVESVSIRHSFDKESLIFLNTSDVLEGKVLHNNYSKVKDLPGQAKKSIKKFDILFSEIRPINKRFAYIDFETDDYVVSTKLMVLRGINNKVNMRYLYYWLTSDKILNYFQLLAETRSGTFPQITFNEIKNTEVLLPSLREQESIANLLDTLTEKIEFNNNINKLLEEIAKEIFKHWFVDFEFPNENGEPYKSSGGKFVESELGMIPEGWTIKSLESLVEIIDNRGKTPPLAKEITSFPIIDVKALSGDGRIIDYNNCTKYVDQEIYENWFRSGHPKQDDILLSTVGSIGEIKFFMGDVGCIAQNVVAIRCNKIKPYYLYQYLKYIKNELVSYNIGSVQPSIKVTHILKHKISIPTLDLENKYNNIIKTITEKIYSNSLENDNLIKIREILLPKLMSGEIRIPEAEEAVESCLQKNN